MPSVFAVLNYNGKHNYKNTLCSSKLRLRLDFLCSFANANAEAGAADGGCGDGLKLIISGAAASVSSVSLGCKRNEVVLCSESVSEC